MRNALPRSEAEKRLRIALLDKGITIERLANDVGLTTGTIRNIIAGGCCGDATRQRITNALGVQIWPNVPVTERGLNLEAGIIVVFPTPNMANEFAAEIHNAAEHRGRHVRLSRDAKLIFKAIGPSLTKRRLRSVSVPQRKEAIEIWSGDEPPDSPFAVKDCGTRAG
jgi:hypothetical protein